MLIHCLPLVVDRGLVKESLERNKRRQRTLAQSQVIPALCTVLLPHTTVQLDEGRNGADLQLGGMCRPRNPWVIPGIAAKSAPSYRTTLGVRQRPEAVPISWDICAVEQR